MSVDLIWLESYRRPSTITRTACNATARGDCPSALDTKQQQDWDCSGALKCVRGQCMPDRLLLQPELSSKDQELERRKAS